MPDFIVVGAVKAGTTSLHHYMGQHPEILMSLQKWPRFFHVDPPGPDFDSLKDKYGELLLAESIWRYKVMCHGEIPRTLDAYKRMWPKQNEKKLLGEISPTYIYDASVPQKILKRFPKIKLIAVLRQPANRAYSHFLMDVAHGWVPEKDFLAALKREPYKIDEFWWGARHYIRHGLYSQRIKYLFKVFPREQVKVMLYDDFQSSPDRFMQEIFTFLGVDSGISIDMRKKHYQTMVVVENSDAENEKSRQLMKPPRLPDDTYRSLTDFFAPDIKRLQDLIGRDLSNWLN